MENRVISVLIGLIGACGNNPKTENTDRLVIRSLALTPCCSDCNNDEVKNIIDEIRAEKNRIAPECALCASPCGNTSDFDMSRIDASDEDIRRLKLQILSELHKIAVCAAANDTQSLSEDETELLYKALSYVSCDMEAESLQTLLNELQEIKRKIKGEAK